MISPAIAQNTTAAQDPLLSFLPLILMFVVLYFLMIRPQMKRAKEHKNLVENLQKNDEGVTSGGVVGKISQVDNNYITLEIGTGASNLQILVQRQAKPFYPREQLKRFREQ